jgi:hypothetical protein
VLHSGDAISTLSVCVLHSDDEISTLSRCGLHSGDEISTLSVCCALVTRYHIYIYPCCALVTRYQLSLCAALWWRDIIFCAASTAIVSQHITSRFPASLFTSHKMEEVCLSETLFFTYQTTRCNDVEDYNSQMHEHDFILQNVPSKCPSLQAARPWRKHQRLNHISGFRLFFKHFSRKHEFHEIGWVTAIRCVGNRRISGVLSILLDRSPWSLVWEFSTLCCWEFVSLVESGTRKAGVFVYGREWNNTCTCTV